jgi:hypothetical protein
MANVNHSTLTDPYLHEPKGIASAGAGNIYVSDGAGSGNWTKDHAHINGYIPFDATTPAYTHSVLTGFTVLNPTFSTNNVDGFSGTTTPNARLQYTDSNSLTAFATFTFNFKNSSGADRNLETVFYLNGAPTNAHLISTAVSGEWRTVTLSETMSLSLNDYIEIFVKGDAAFTLEVAAASLIIHGVPS